jgi:hypothetical protein
MRRRTFIAGLGSAAAWPVLAQGDRVRGIGAIMGSFQFSAFTQVLADLVGPTAATYGWTFGGTA